MPKAFLVRWSLLTAGLLGFVGCTVHPTKIPELAGPSELALSFNVTATPDAVPQDGSSTSALVVQAFDAAGSPKSGVTFRVEIQVGGIPVDYGKLSSKTITTKADGRASTVYTAPAAIPTGATLDSCAPNFFSAPVSGSCVQIVATPVGTDFGTTTTQFATIHLVPLGEIVAAQGGTGAPTATFVSSPSAPSVGTQVLFDASLSRAGTGHTIVSYQWQWGDGESTNPTTSPNEDHDYQSAGLFSVILTVTDEIGQSGTVSKTLKVS
jgi:PKD repeat protein